MSAPASPPPAEPPQEGERDAQEPAFGSLEDFVNVIDGLLYYEDVAREMGGWSYAQVDAAISRLRARATRETQPPLDRGFPLGRVDGVAHLIRTRLGLSYDDGRVESVAAKILDLYGQPIGGEGAGSPRGEP